MIEEMRQALALRRDPKLVDELLLAYQEAKSEFYRGGLRLQAVEGGRFCEAAFRLLQEEATGSFVPLGGSLKKTDELIKLLASLPKNGGPPARFVCIFRDPCGWFTIFATIAILRIWRMELILTYRMPRWLLEFWTGYWLNSFACGICYDISG